MVIRPAAASGRCGALPARNAGTCTATIPSTSSAVARRITAPIVDIQGVNDPVEVLRRWEDHGAVWRVVSLSDERAVVDLCTCHGEPVERLESTDAALLRFLAERSSPQR